MRVFKGFWVKITYYVQWLSLLPGQLLEGPQVPLLGNDENQLSIGHPHYPIFKPPGGRREGPGSEFNCTYPKMPGWESCSTAEDRSCWILNKKTGEKFDIHTNYETSWPNGTDRYYDITISDEVYNADGMWFPYAKLFNGQLPGPWIQACWGDKLHITVHNNLTFNGTSIHWHGIRQLNTMHMDGVNGITQCPIAPGDSFVYNWNTTQYGSSWYHSHYSVQYADGAQGPISIHGPSSRPFDEPKLPLLMTDWSHNSAFQAIYNGPDGPVNRSILLNGTGNIVQFSNGSIQNTTTIPPKYTLHFNSKKSAGLGRPKRYLLRLINTSYDSAFIFSIDNHKLKIIEADFVPIHPYEVRWLLIGIGQRYHVVVEAEPIPDNSIRPPNDGNFWIRTYVADGCGKAGKGDYMKTGILRYDNTSTSDPISIPWTNNLPECWDEPIANMTPVFNWTVQGPKNNVSHGEEFDVTLQKDKRPYGFKLGTLSLEPALGNGFTPLQVYYGDPIFQHLDEYNRPWPQPWVVIPENYTAEDWIILILNNPMKKTFPGAHPIHLHGHDFAVLKQDKDVWYHVDDLANPDFIKFPVENPARRDVVLLPKNGSVIIAFKADNPGTWLMHCHIAFHASEGLALQILERQADANAIWPHGNSAALDEAARVCANWNAFEGNCSRWWHDEKTISWCSNGTQKLHFFGDDSGI